MPRGRRRRSHPSFFFKKKQAPRLVRIPKKAVATAYDRNPFLPEALEKLVLDPAAVPGAAISKCRRDPSGTEQESLAVHAAWRRAAEVSPEEELPRGPGFAALFHAHPLAWGTIENLTQRTLWLA